MKLELTEWSAAVDEITIGIDHELHMALQNMNSNEGDTVYISKVGNKFVIAVSYGQE